MAATNNFKIKRDGERCVKRCTNIERCEISKIFDIEMRCIIQIDEFEFSFEHNLFIEWCYELILCLDLTFSMNLNLYLCLCL